MKDKIEKIDVEQMTKNLRVNNAEAFRIYLKDIFVDLLGRVTENKNDPKEKQIKHNGITKTVFDKYYELPGIIGDRLYRVFNRKNREYISVSDFIAGMTILFCEDYEKTSKFIFDLYDNDNDGKINKEDIRTILSYITIGESPKSKSPMKNISYKNRITSQEELNNILKTCFNDIKNDYITYEDFKRIVEEVNSDIYLMIYLFLLENKPFKRENVESYLKPEERNSPTISPSPKKMIASPTKNTQFSPYRKVVKRKSVILDQKQTDDLHKMMGHSPKNMDSPKYRQAKRRRTLEGKEPIISLKNMELKKEDDEIKTKEINNKRIEQITKIQNKRKKYEEGDIIIEPAYKQTKKKNNLDNNPLSNKKFMDDDEEKFIDNSYESDEENDIEENYEIDDDEEVLKYEGYLYKLIDNKMRKYGLN